MHSISLRIVRVGIQLIDLIGTFKTQLTKSHVTKFIKLFLIIPSCFSIELQFEL